jgi:hypothetical protein
MNPVLTSAMEQIEGEQFIMSAQSVITPEKIMQLGLGFWGSKTLLSAIEVGLFTELAGGPSNAQGLAGRLGLHSRCARDFFDALVALGMLEREGGLYRNTAETDLFLVRGRPSYIGGMLEMANERLYPFWGSLTEGLRTGLPQNEIKTGGRGPFESIYGDPDRLRLFLGAQGGLLVQVCLAHPHLGGTNFDLPVVGPIYEEYVAANGLSDRLNFLPGNFFDDPLPPAEVITMGHILHDWDLDEKRMLLAKAYRALPEGGALIVFEALIDDERRENAFGLLMSLNMLIVTPAGGDYTRAECATWLREAGCRETYAEHLLGPDSMVVGIK